MQPLRAGAELFTMDRAGTEVVTIRKVREPFGILGNMSRHPVTYNGLVWPHTEALFQALRFAEDDPIREEIRAIEQGRSDRADNPLKNAPHTAHVVTADTWNRPYSREQAAFPAPWLREHKFWPPVGRVDNAYGDRNLMCTCPPMEDYE